MILPVDNTESTGSFKSGVNMVLTAVGVGVLALPLAIAQSGWAIGVLLLFATWALSQTMMYLLWKCIMTEMERGVFVMDSYGAVGEAALGKSGRYLVAAATYITLSALCVIILILLAGGLFSLTGVLTIDAWTLIAAIIVLPLSWLPTLKEVAIISTFGLIGVCTIGIVVLVAAITMDSSQRGDISHFPGTVSGLVMSFIEFMNSYAVAAVIPTIISGMKDPNTFPKVSAYAFVTISVCFAVIGFAGYLGWGDKLLDSDGNITSMLSDGVLNTICQVSIIFVTLSHFLVVFNPVALFADSVLDLLPVNHTKGSAILMHIFARSALVGFFLLLALYIPSFGTIVNLLGSTVVMPLQVLFTIWFYSIICRLDIRSWSTTRQSITYAFFIVAVFLSLLVMGYGLFNVITHWK